MSPDPQALKRIGTAMGASSPKDWKRITLYVSAVASGNQTKLSIEMQDGTIDGSQGISADGHFAIRDLHDSMYEDGVGTWYNATIVLTPEGQLDADFDYDHPPFGGDYTPEMLEDDQEAYPRSQEHLPAWHPSRK